MAMYAEYTYHFQLRKERKHAAQEKDRLVEMMEGLKLQNDMMIRQNKEQAIKTDQVLDNLDEARGERDAIAEQCDAIAQDIEAVRYRGRA
jgi:hypothetical protein